MAENINYYRNIHENESGSKLNYIFSLLISILTVAIKAYLIYRIWVTFLIIDVSFYVNSIVESDFYRSIITFLNTGVAWLGMILLSGEVLLQFYWRIQVFRESHSPGKKINFLQLNFFMFPFVHGFFPEVFFSWNEIDIKTDENFFVYLYIFKTYVLIAIVVVIIGSLVCVIAAFFCGKGEYLGTIKTTTIYNSGRKVVSYDDQYGPDIESAGFYCGSGLGCGLILLICIILFFPFIIGMFAYVYNMAYLEELSLQILYFSEFCLNFLYVYFFAVFYL